MNGEQFIPAMELVVARLTAAGADRAVLDEVGDLIEMAAASKHEALALAGLVVAGEARFATDPNDLVGVGAWLAAGAFARHLMVTAEVAP